MARYGDLGTQYFDDAGDPLVNGKVYFYETGTTTLKATYADVDYTIANTNPVILTAAGRQPNIFFEGVAKAILATSAGTQILVRDPVGDTAESFGNPWISSKRYSANDVVQGSDGQYYVSLINGNVNLNPVTTTGNWTFLYSVEWNAGTTYKEGSVITYQSLVYQSLQNTNLNKNPLTETTFWTAIQLSWISTVTYALNANVVASNGVLYTSIQAANTNNAPATSPLWWVGTSAAAAASASAAAASASAASTSATNAATSASTATTQASNASASASSASTSASNASTSASNASTSASNAATSASSALSSANSATSSASSATSSASSASTSASNAATSETNAAASASTASTAATTATTKASEASASASAASTSASNAATSETNAGNSASTASAAASTASSAATNASASASTASTKASEAVSSAAAASSSAAAAANSAASAAAITNISSVQVFTDPLAKAIRVALLASASVRAPQVLDNANLDMGTNNFSVVVQKRITTTRPAANEILYHKHDGTTGVIVTLLTTGIVRLTLNATTFDSTVALTSASNVEPVIIIPVTRETTTAAGSVTFVVDGVQLGTAVAITAGAPTSVDNASNLYLLGTSTTTTEGAYYDGAIYNRALTVAECLAYCLRGPDVIDMGGSNTNFFTGDSVNFEGGTVGSWAANTGNGVTSVAVNTVSPISGTYDLKVITNGLVNSGIALNIGSVVLGEKYRLVFDYKGATSNAWGVVFRNNANPASGSVWASTVTGGTTWQPATAGQLVYEFTASLTTSSGRVHILNSVVDTIQLDKFQLINLGITGHWPAFNAQTNTGQIFDQSGNKNHMLLPASGATILAMPPDRRRQVRWTNTWAATQELQYIGGVNQAILPANAYIESIVGTVSGATPHDIIVGDGSSTNRYVTITTALAAGTNTFTVANRTTDATNLKLTVTPDTAATMSIAWVITYYLLES